MIGPAEIDEMMAEHADAVAGSEPAETSPAETGQTPVGRVTDGPVAAPAPPYRTFGLVPTSFLFPFGRLG